MPQFRETVGRHLARILIADGWSVAWERGNKMQLAKDGYKPILITLHLPITKKRVKSLCQSAGMSAARFDELYRTTVEMRSPADDQQRPFVH